MAEHIKVKNEEQDHPLELPAQIEVWNKHHLKQWALGIDGLDHEFANILFQQHYNGTNLLILDQSDFLDLKIPLGPAKLILHAREDLLKMCRKEQPLSHPLRPCKPYPFHRHHDACRYRLNSILDVTESGATNYVEPCHEFKAYVHTPNESKITKFIREVIPFGAACMNSRSNGTIHFGVGDKPEFTHGQVLGVEVLDKEEYENALKCAIEGHFEHKHIEAAKRCFKHPRFVEVLNPDTTASENYVIEVDIVPDYVICKDNIYHVYSVNSKTTKKSKSKDKNNHPLKVFYIRDGSSSRNLLAESTSSKPMEEFSKFCSKITQLSQLRKQAEERHLVVVKSSSHGSKLSQIITGGSQSLDKTHFEQYVIVTNKSHTIHLESLGFLIELNPTAVLDFDPDSGKNGLQKHFEAQSTINVHLPAEYKMTEAIEELASTLKLTRNTSWVFCNGGVNGEVPSDTNDWLIEKGASVRDVISLLCRKDVLTHKRYLVIFLLLTAVNDQMDPLLESFSTFWQELKGTEQILCICENENSFTSWKELIENRWRIDITARCIYELSFAEVNGTVLSLWSGNRKSSRFLPCSGGGKVQLDKKVERDLNTLDVLCANQCEGGNEDKGSIEERFYQGGKASWWNFYFSEQPGSTPFIKRDMFDFILNSVLPNLCSLRKVCVSFNLKHIPGCGGTTLAMHILWSQKEKFRCAVLKDRTADFTKAACQVVDLLLHDTPETSLRLPVLLMIDYLEEMEKVYDLQQQIEKECVKRDIGSRSPQVILLNCIRAESGEQTKVYEDNDTVFIGNNLSESEQKQFENKLVEIEKTFKNAETFYGFMIMKKNFSPEYIRGVARNTLKSFNLDNKHAQLIAVLVLLNVYCKGASLSISLCEEFLGLQPKPFCGTIKVEDGFGKFSTLVTSCTVEAKVVFKGLRMIHSIMAEHCLSELTTTYGVTKADIINLLLNIDKFYECLQGKDTLMRDVHYMLVKRRRSLFSPLIQEILTETPGVEQTVLFNAAKRFENDAFIAQLLARYHYLKKQDFPEAKDWSQKAKKLARDNSYIADTSAQVVKHELKNALKMDKDVPIQPESLKRYLKLSLTATEAFRETQDIAKEESILRLKNMRDDRPFNTVGCLGEIQVAVLIIEILRKTPVFSTEDIRHDLLSEILSDKIKIQEVERSDPRHNKNTHYYRILKEFEDLLHNLRYHMKKHFDFLDNFYVNLGSLITVKDSKEQRHKDELSLCFQQYVGLFCTNSAELLKNKTMDAMLRVHRSVQYLEKMNADTYSGIFKYLEWVKSDVMEKVVRKYEFILGNSEEKSVKRMVNQICANVVLSCIKPSSKYCKPYKTLIDILCKALQGQIQSNDILALSYIAVALLWPQPMCSQPAESERLGKYVSQMRTSYLQEMGPVYNGKRPVVHFFLGKKQGYDRLIHLGVIERCVQGGNKQYSSLWQNGEIWKEKAVEQLLCRLTGKIHRQKISADTFNEDQKIDVSPMFKSQLSGRQEGSEVSFYVGFSLNGPLAIDIQ